MKRNLKHILSTIMLIFAFGSTYAQINIENIWVTQPECRGDSSGQLIVKVSGTAPFNYSLTGGGYFQEQNGTASDSVVFTDMYVVGDSIDYILVVGDAQLIPPFDFAVITLRNPDSLYSTGVVTHLTCFGDTDGEINTTTQGSTGPYDYSWAHGPLTEDVTGLAAGDYYLTIEDTNNCTHTDTFTVIEPDEMAISANITDISCFGANDGIISITGVTGGDGSGAGYSYSVDGAPYDANTNKTNLTPGVHLISVRDNSGCIKDTSFTINEPPALTLSGVITHVSCNGGTDGAIDATSGGGTAPLSFLWAPGGTTGEDTMGVGANNYTLTVTDANNCMIAQAFNVTEPSAIDIQGVITDVTCFGGSDGAIDVTTTDGTGPYTWSWSPGGSVGEDTMGLDTGTYTINVLDNNNCPASRSFVINQPDDLAITANITNITCFGADDGIISITSTAGGTAGYTYAIDGGGYGAATVFNGLTPGAHVVSIRDVNLCTKDTTLNISEPLPMIMDLTITNISCFGNTDGQIDINSVTNGTPGYNYAINSPAGPFGPTTSFTNLGATSHTITVEDNNGCRIDSTVMITEPDSMIIFATATDIDCFGNNNGVINVTGVTGGTPGYNYAIDGGGFSATTTFTNLSAGAHTVTVRDNNNCTEDTIITISEPLDLSTTAIITPATCNGGADGAIDLTPVGGTLPIISYSWLPGGETTEDISGLTQGDYIVALVDQNNCLEVDTFTVIENLPIIIADSITNVSCFGGSDGAINITISGGNPPYGPITWDHGPNTEDVSGLSADTFVVMVNDVLGCSSSDTFIVTEPLPINISGIITPTTCRDSTDGAIDVTIAGGATPYQSTIWTPGGTNAEDTSGVGAGTYYLTVTDSNGCVQVDSFIVTEPDYINSTGVLTQPTCDNDTDGAIDITTTGGSGVYVDYNWNSGAFTTEDISGLDSNQYIVTVTDDNGCIGIDTFDLTDPDPISSTALISLAACNGGSDGAIDLTALGGSGTYISYNWNSGAFTTEDLTGIPAGNYNVLITDDQNCTGTSSYTVTENTPIVIADSINHVSCFGLSDGSVDITVSGGVPPYMSFSWNGGAFTTEDLTAVPADTYIVRIEDNVNCVTLDTFIVNEPPQIIIDDSITHVLCGGDSTGAIDLTVSGGAGNFSFLWGPGSTGEDTTNVPAGTYAFTATDSNGCSANGNFTVNENTPLSLASTTNSTCTSDAVGGIDITVSGGVTPYSYEWNGGAFTTEDLTNIAGGTYTVEVTDSVGCIINSSITLTADPLPTGTLVSSTDTACWGQMVTVTAALDNPPFFPNPAGSYSFDNGATFSIIDQFTFTPSVAGDTIVTVIFQDVLGCVSEPDTVEIHALPEITATLDTIVFPTCTGPPGELRVHNISGGLAPYSVSFDGAPAVVTSDTTYINISPGIHTIDIFDAHGCSWSSSVNFLSSITADIDTLEPTCYGFCDGEIALSNVGGGVAPYEFSINDTIADPFSPADSTFTGLCAGNQTIYVKDATGCLLTLNINLDQPDSLQILQLGIKNESCNGLADGEITVAATGGNNDYTFTFGMTTINGVGPFTFTNLAAGQDTVFLSDSAGCATELPFTINPSDSLAVYLSELSPTNGCNSTEGIGIVDSVVGGSGDFQFSINGGVSFQDTTVFANLLSGSYLVITRDKVFGCEDTSRFTISAPGGADMDAIVNDITDPSCLTNDGSISLTNINGDDPFSYQLSGPVTMPTQSDSTFTGLTEGFYFITITDNNGCNYEYYFFIGPPTPLNVLATPTPETCINQDGSLVINISGGKMPYRVNVDNGNGFMVDTNISVSSLTLNNLSSGVYDVSVADSSNPSCTDFLSVTISSNRSDAILNRDTVTCPWSSDGNLTIDLADNAFYSFTFSIDDTLSFDTSRTRANLMPGVHELWIKQYDLLTGDSCVYPDNETYYYVPWNDTLLGTLYDSLSYASMWEDTSVYDTFTVANFIVFAPDSLDITFTTTNADKNETNGTALLHGISGGTPGYEFAFGDTTAYTTYNLADTTQNMIINLPPGDTLVYLRDSNMCRQEFVMTVGINLFIPNIFSPNGDGDNDVFEICGLTEDAELSVYNRWGSRVYYKGVYDNSWDGEKLSDGTYFFEIKTVSGETYKGWVDIIR